MSLEEIKALEAEEEELRAKLEEKRALRVRLQANEAEKAKAEALRAEQEKPIVVTVRAQTGGNLLVHSSFRTDLVEVWRNVPGRHFRGGEENLIPVKSWEECEKKVLALPNISITWEKGVKDQLDWYLNAPAWKIDVDVRRGQIFLTGRPGPETSRWLPGLNAIAGFNWDYDQNDFTIPESEGWRLYKVLDKVVGVVYSKEAHELILAQIERRARLDKIAQKTETDNERVLEIAAIWDAQGFKIRPFQGVGAEFLVETDMKALILDQTGLGKTCQTILPAEIKRLDNPRFITVCAVKSANIPNWIREIRRLTKTEPFVCSNYGKTRFKAIGELMAKRGINYSYFIISHDLLGTYEEEEDQNEPGKMIKRYTWSEIFINAGVNYLIVDEAHQIKNAQTHRFRGMRPMAAITPHRVLATATPVLNRTTELWTLLHMLDPIMFASFEKFKDNYTVDGKIPKNVEGLHELLRPMSLRRKKSDVLKDLPPINRIEKIHTLSDDAMGRYKEALEGLYRQIRVYDPFGADDSTMNITHILAQFIRLKQICSEDKIDYTVELVMGLVDEANGSIEDGKVLVFTQFLGVAYEIAKRINEESMKLYGYEEAVCTVKMSENPSAPYNSMNSVERDELFEDARVNGRVKYIITTEAAKEGHNLEFCNWVVFNDPFWTPAGHEQCEGRAYGRLSNPHPIDSFYVRADTEIEEWIFELLIKKMEIIDATVDSTEMTRDLSGSIAMDLIKKIKESMWENGR